jgi:trigger factor
LFLLAVADREELTVDPSEIDDYIQSMAKSSGQDFEKLKNFYEQNNLLFALKDSLLADKAMERIYEKAEVKIIPPAKDPETSEQQPDQT